MFRKSVSTGLKRTKDADSKLIDSEGHKNRISSVVQYWISRHTVIYGGNFAQKHVLRGAKADQRENFHEVRQIDGRTSVRVASRQNTNFQR